MKKYLLLTFFAISQSVVAEDIVDQLEFSKKLHPIESSTQYYQPGDRWTSGDKMEKVHRNREFEDIAKPYRYYYLTNNNENDVVKGVIRKYVKGLKQSKYDMFDFVILPGNTVYLGRFLSSVDFKIGEATIVTKKDLPTLEKSQELQKKRISD